MATRILLGALTLLLCTAGAVADNSSAETDWLKLQPGYQEDTLGARVDSVSEPDSDGAVIVEVSIPNRGARQIEEVLVTGHREDVHTTAVREDQVQLINDLKNGRTGLVIHLSSKSNFRLMINYFDYNDPGVDKKILP